MAAALLRNNWLMYNLKINFCTHDYSNFLKSYIIKSKSIKKIILSLVIVLLRYCGVNLDPT